MPKNKRPSIEGWFTMDEAAPRLIGTRCAGCETVYFPREETYCRNPRCASTELEEYQLSNTGRIWSFTNNCYPPPAPYIASDPFEPYAVAAVELADEKMVVLGQVSGAGVEDLKAGMEVEVVLETLFEDDENEYMIWKWRPTELAA
jgi:uncharacterized OB-fold protein